MSTSPSPLRPPLLGRVALVSAGVCLAACAAQTSGAAGDLPGGSYDGLWQGDGLAFSIRGSAVEDLVIEPQTCTGDSCQGAAGGSVAGSFALAAGIAIHTDALDIRGRFDGLNMVAGTWSLTAANGCCKVLGAWSAERLAPLPGGSSSGGSSSGGSSSGGSSSGGSSSGGPSSGGSSGASLGSHDWDGNSRGDVHPGPRRKAPTLADDPQLSSQQNAALVELDRIRALVGLAPATQDRRIAAAAQAHATFYVKHFSQYQSAKLSPHQEDPSFGAGFAAATFAERMKKAGFPGPPGAEVMAFSGSPHGALRGWLATVYHRLPLLDPRTTEMGFGLASSAKARAEVMDTSAGGSSAGSPIVVYPVPGQTDVPTAWSGKEGPQPPGPASGYPSGPVISARTPAAVKWLEHELLGPGGKALEHVWLSRDNDKILAALDARTVALYADQPLMAATTYVVRLVFEDGGGKRVLKWRFSTQ